MEGVYSVAARLPMGRTWLHRGVCQWASAARVGGPSSRPALFSVTLRVACRDVVPPLRKLRSRLPRVSVNAVNTDLETQQRRVELPETVIQGGPVVVTDEAVPEGHQGLHGFLYGEGGADIHNAEETAYRLRAGEDDGQVLIPLLDFLASREGHRLAGVYAVFDAQDALQYVGYSRNIALSLKAHNTHPLTSALAAAVRVRVFADPAMLTRARLDEERQLWLAELCRQAGIDGAPGNSTSRDAWEGRGQQPRVEVMSERERAEYEEKKLKMRKAMGENLHDDVEGESGDSRQRRLALLQAVEGDDWSAVIRGQTQATLPAAVDASPALAPPTSASGPAAIASPFETQYPVQPKPGGEGQQQAGDEDGEEAMSTESVDRALEAVRPYLIADGGNVEVVGVENGVVALRLQGACGTCPSSTTTMKMGIERVLRERFPTQLLEVAQVDAAAGGGLPTVALVDSHLDMLRPAIHNFKGSVEVVRVEPLQGLCEVKYSGPPPVGMGIQAAIRDKFPMLHTVKLLDL